MSLGARESGAASRWASKSKLPVGHERMNPEVLGCMAQDATLKLLHSELDLIHDFQPSHVP